ncbi:biopolymer transporter ExbD [bacterium]|nr:biopolymer transporter ExbD [bacterium]
MNVKFAKKSKVSQEIPTASMPDIVFMLLLFFMVTTVFRQFSGLPVDLPSARKIEKLDAKKNVANIWASVDGEISVDDKIVEDVKTLRLVMHPKVAENPRLITSLKIDRGTPMHFVTDIHQELREAGALRVNYCAKSGL